MSDEPVIPAPLEDDDDDVAWALQTAAVQWNRGAQADAVVWIRRAVDAAIACGNSRRTKDLTRLASEVADLIVARVSLVPEARTSDVPEASDVDALLDQEPAEEPTRGPPPRKTAQTLSNEIPIEFDADILEDAAEEVDPELDEGAGEWSGAPDEGEPPPLPPDLDDGHPEASAPGSEVALGHRQDDDEDDDEDDDMPTLPPGPREDAGLLGDMGGVLSAPPLSVHPDELLDGDASPPGDSEFDAPTRPLDDEDALSAPALAESAPPVSTELDSPPPLPPAPESEGPSFEEGQEADFTSPEEEALPPPPGSSADPGAPIVAGIALGEVRGFEDLPEEAQVELARLATLTTLSEDEEVGAFGAALVIRGEVGLMSSIADVAASIAFSGEVVFTRGTLAEGVALRVVALQGDTVVATWTPQDLDRIMADCPWVADELRLVADRFQALAGATLGSLGDRLDDALRGQVFSKLEVKAFQADEIIVAAGKPVPGLHVVGAGRVEIGPGSDEAVPGDILFAAEVLGAGAAAAEARAGKGGALVLFASRTAAHELLLEVPPLIEILAG